MKGGHNDHRYPFQGLEGHHEVFNGRESLYPKVGWGPWLSLWLATGLLCPRRAKMPGRPAGPGMRPGEEPTEASQPLPVARAPQAW